MLKNKIEIKIIESFYSKVLNNIRKIRIYLPPSYSTEKNRNYPVLYIHDGQNVFEGKKSYSGESWNLHQKAEQLIKENLIEEIIIVAVDNMEEERLSEYAHQDGFFEGEKVKGRGFDYEKFFIRELMPFIGQHYRIKKGSENTALMGSSMGGLVTFNIGLRRSDLFSKLAVMSPSFWWGKSSPSEKINSYNYKNLNSQIWLDTGEAEGKFMSFTENVISELKHLKNNFSLDLIYYQVPEAIHSETAWASRVHCPLLYFYGDMGKIKEIELIGEEKIALKGAKKRINPIVTFESTFKMTALEGDFKSLKPEVLKINKNGVITPKKAGSADIQFNAFGYKAYKNIKIVKKIKPNR
ncbi:putative alpha/beta superfamily hydrolase [Halanaerobium saccharolyticum]|uniref:Putative alpha/beta superfamily hydrolase n=1 Tax=Halanaerobium saccharolyticum TaxID=43595 RepID=A0A4R7YMS3_9FIRM|nr:alpha/beta hydrolase-fold protein [Halanaerobium saccharolyticum]RAK04144.1 putative alpha/beta superfamily hydrolase [Halanaerobium saccharolyticum]TDV97939.1 putative alpha/beta superfamily hydrolase [Halanaerobium saccharolyticum]TDX51000.1 putative alpha/beta superfamily hydrolase [Halanaerobium saccharolyticum]